MENTHIFKPILFSTEMVQAISDGRKTQTRRPAPFDKFCTEAVLTTNGKWQEIYNNNPDPNKMFPGGWMAVTNYKSKYQPGDILWVRERFEYSDNLEEPYWYYAKYIQDYLPEYVEQVKWRPSIHMPKEAARIFLKVTSVRCERLQDISEEDAIAEGMEEGYVCGYLNPESTKMKVWRMGDGENYELALWAFRALWDSINVKKYPWKSNPWVWVYEFERIEKPENFN